MKRFILAMTILFAVSMAHGQGYTYGALMCVNPSGQIIPVLQAGTPAPTNYPQLQAFGTNSLNQSVALQCDASGNLLANATSIGGIPFIDVPTPVLSDTICFDGVAWTPCPPTAGPAQILYITNTASDISTYDLWDTVPLGAQFTVAASIPATNTKTLIKAFATASGYPNLTVIPAGEWQADTYAQISSSANTTTLNIDLYDRTSGGVETLLFSFADINITTAALTHYTIEAVEPAFTVAATDRIVIKYNMTHNTGSAITGTIYGGGSTNYSHVHTPIGTNASPSFSSITSGLNNAMAAIVGTGASITLGETGTSAWGTIESNALYDTALLNNTSTGTTATYAACVDTTTANSVIDCPANAVQQVLGITTAGAGTTGYAKVLRLAMTTTATFVGSTTSAIGNYATTSSAVGKLLDTGSTIRPTCGNAIVGIITAANTGTTHTVLVRPEALPACGTLGQVMQATSATAIGLAANPSSPVVLMNGGDTLCAMGGDTTVGAIAITGGSSTSTTATVTASSQPYFYVGQLITVNGATPSGFNVASAAITGVAGSTITYSTTNNPGAWSSGGTIALACENAVDAPFPGTVFTGNRYTVPANSIAAGNTYQLTAQMMVLTSSAPPTFYISEWYGATLLSVQGAFTFSRTAPTWTGSVKYGTTALSATQLAGTFESLTVGTGAGAALANLLDIITVSNASPSTLGLGIGFTATGVASGTYTSGGSIVGTAGQTCTLTSFNNSSTATATVALTNINTIAGGTALTIVTRGQSATAAPTTATLGSGTATCSGTATIATVLGGAPGNAAILVDLVERP